MTANEGTNKDRAPKGTIALRTGVILTAWGLVMIGLSLTLPALPWWGLTIPGVAIEAVGLVLIGYSIGVAKRAGRPLLRPIQTEEQPGAVQ
jgi:hypothetical protein